MMVIWRRNIVIYSAKSLKKKTGKKIQSKLHQLLFHFIISSPRVSILHENNKQ